MGITPTPPAPEQVGDRHSFPLISIGSLDTKGNRSPPSRQRLRWIRSTIPLPSILLARLTGIR